MKSRFDHKLLPLPVYWHSYESDATPSYPPQAHAHTLVLNLHEYTQEFPEPKDNTEGPPTYLPSSSY